MSGASHGSSDIRLRGEVKGGLLADRPKFQAQVTKIRVTPSLFNTRWMWQSGTLTAPGRINAGLETDQLISRTDVSYHGGASGNFYRHEGRFPAPGRRGPSWSRQWCRSLRSGGPSSSARAMWHHISLCDPRSDRRPRLWKRPEPPPWMAGFHGDS